MQPNYQNRSDAPRIPPFKGFFYVDQANYAVVSLQDEEVTYLYSDSATSCIIAIAVGQNANSKWLASLAHVDSPECIDAYFTDVLDKNLVGQTYFFAQGANPPDNQTSIDNAAALKQSLSAVRPWQASNPILHLLEGDPRQDNRGDLGINLKTIEVSNQPFDIGLSDRDPTGGVQVLFSIMRRQISPPIQIRDAREPFSSDLVAELVQIGSTYRKNPNDPQTSFTNIINLQSQEVRNTWSSTPEFEANWFSDELKQSSCFTLRHNGK